MSNSTQTSKKALRPPKLSKVPNAGRTELETLVDELIKTTPNEEIIRQRMIAAGLPYSVDSIQRMNQVLESIEKVKTVSAVNTPASAKPDAQREANPDRPVESIQPRSKRKERDNVQDL